MIMLLTKVPKVSVLASFAMFTVLTSTGCEKNYPYKPNEDRGPIIVAGPKPKISEEKVEVGGPGKKADAKGPEKEDGKKEDKKKE